MVRSLRGKSLFSSPLAPHGRYIEVLAGEPGSGGFIKHNSIDYIVVLFVLRFGMLNLRFFFFVKMGGQVNQEALPVKIIQLYSLGHTWRCSSKMKKHWQIVGSTVFVLHSKVSIFLLKFWFFVIHCTCHNRILKDCFCNQNKVLSQFSIYLLNT